MIERTPLITIAAVLYIVTGLAYSIGTIPVTRHLIRHRSLPAFGRIHFYEGSFFDRQGIHAVIAASLAFIALGVLFLWVGYLLWHSMKLGGIATLVLFPIVMLAAIGSMAPFPWVIEPLKVLLVLLGWRTLS
ncbi:MAG TPA: hypothetical protein VI524_15250 [Anaerolineales bacterium]|nr:hypothetical protein [Anaerolineales bacterium]